MSDFRPLPLLGNPHIQTLLSNLLPAPALPGLTTIHHVDLADGQRLLAYDTAPPRWRPGQPIAVLVHGLGGNHQSPIVCRVSRRLLDKGLRIVRLDLPSCGKGIALSRRPYDAGSSHDVRAVLELAHRWSPTSPLFLLGFSLGGNIVLKLAGEAAAQPVPGLQRVVAVAPPIDLERCCDLICQPRNRLYELNFLRELLDLVRRRERCFPDMPRTRFPRSMTLRQFDELYTAPRGGHASAQEYYRRSSSLPLIPEIRVPTLILTARDDPFIVTAPFESLAAPAHVEVRILNRGGHLGFLGWDDGWDFFWGDRRVIDWVTRP